MSFRIVEIIYPFEQPLYRFGVAPDFDNFRFLDLVEMIIVLSRRCLEFLAGKLIALLLDFSFELIKIDRFGFLYRVFEQQSQVDLLENDSILSKILSYELIALFQLHPMSKVAGQLYPSSIVYFS